MDDADGAFISKTRFLQHWRDKPAMILEPYNIDTEENVLHFLARFDTKYFFTGAVLRVKGGETGRSEGAVSGE